ncbi:MAG: class I SAM-dependent methyltransferase, partial [Elusimicrobia bacterium]|nr:class I SAM-dependent methyltransferase [Elusimicrobiota bacterium]
MPTVRAGHCSHHSREHKAIMADIKLKSREEKRILGGHQWIFSNELEQVDLTIPAGEICRVLSHRGEVLGWGFFNPHSLIAVRIIKRGSAPPPENFIFERIKSAYEYRKNLGLDKFCRVCFSEADFLPGLLIDRYGDYFVAEMLSAGMDNFKHEITAVIKQIFNCKGIFLKNNSEFRKFENLPQTTEVIGDIPEKIAIEENGVKFLISPKSGQKTGFFYDQRDNRQFLKPYFKGRRVLDLYSYVGAFGICAAAWGAEMVWGVDSSQDAVDFANENVSLNKAEGKAIFHKEDAEKTLNAFAQG